MALTAAERQKLSRDRRRRRVTPVTVEVHDKEVEFLAERGYGARLNDPVSISQAVSSFLGDSLVDAMGRKHSTGSRRTLG